jgi:hypothetical protein
MLKISLGFLLGFLLLLALAIVSYMPPSQTIYRPATTLNDSPKFDSYSSKEGPHPYSYSFSFVEINDDGLFSDSAQIDHLMTDLKSKVNQTDTVILLYVHGWNHNARVGDDNVACFEELVKATAIMQSGYVAHDKKIPRAVYGIYVGWPAVIYENEKLNKVATFFGRQSAADRIGERGALLQLFSRISQLRHEPRPQQTKFVIVSHSLGGRLTYKTLRPIMQNSVYESDNTKSPFLADVAVLVNPALSAEEHTALAELIEAQARPAIDKQPRFIIATSEKDEVLGSVYPWSQRFSSFIRGDYALNNKARVFPVGLYDRYVTHLLDLEGEYAHTSRGNACPTLRYDELEIVKGKRRVQSDAELYNYKVIKHYDEDGTNEKYRTVLTETGNKSKGPIMVVKVSGEIIPNHNDIFTSPFVDFVSRVVNVGLYGPR